MVVAAAVVLAAAGCSTADASIYRVVGGGTSCDAEACPPGNATYSLRLATTDEPLTAARSFDISEDAPPLGDVTEYPACVRAEIVGGVVEGWEPVDCP
jgi:hypothetical protein